jgi:hypothetical protein
MAQKTVKNLTSIGLSQGNGPPPFNLAKKWLIFLEFSYVFWILLSLYLLDV